MDLPTHRRSFTNPFDLGPIANLGQFFTEDPGIWMTLFSVPEHKGKCCYKDKVYDMV